MEIRMATAGDRAALCEIWLSSFTTDTEQDCHAFLDIVNLPSECMVACENTRPVAMVFLLPATLCVDTIRYPISYIYAAATHAAYRGRGIFSVLLTKALEFQKQQGAVASFLSPQEPSLVGFYRRFKYEPFCYRRVLRGMAQSARIEIERVTADVYQAARQDLLPQGHICWEERFLNAEVLSSTPVRVQGNGYALCRKNGSTLHITERLGTAQLVSVCEQLAADFGCSDFVAFEEGDSGDCFGMILPFSDKVPVDTSVYMGFSFG